MDINKIEETNFQITTIKTDNFKCAGYSFTYIIPYTKRDLHYTHYLACLLKTATKNYQSSKDLECRFEELYNGDISFSVHDNGINIFLEIKAEFINPKYVDDSLADDMMNMMYEYINNPDIINGEFNDKTFKLAKNQIIRDIEVTKENPNQVAFYNAIHHLDPDCFLGVFPLGTVEDIDAIKPFDMAKYYIEFFEKAALNIVIGGNLDMNHIIDLIKKNQKFNVINDYDRNKYISYNHDNKNNYIVEESENEQAIFFMFYGNEGLTSIEEYGSNDVFNYLLGGGGMQNKLFKSVREKNSLCYSINSRYQINTGLLQISAGIEGTNCKKVEKLVKKAMKEFCDGNFTDEEIESAKRQIINGYQIINDDLFRVMNKESAILLYNIPDIEECIECVKKVTKEDIIAIAKKYKFELTYMLKEGENHGNK